MICLARNMFLRSWPQINHKCSQLTLVSGSWFRPWCSLSRLQCARFVRIHFRCQVSPMKRSQARRSQETWLARRCCQNLERCVRNAWLSICPLIQLLRALSYRIAETRAHRSRRHHPLLMSLAVVDTVVRSGHCAADCTVCHGNHL